MRGQPDSVSNQYCVLTDAEVQEFYRLSRFYWREAERCQRAKAYLAGTVMLGAWVETVLVIFADMYGSEGEMEQATRRKRKPLLEWTFAELLRLARKAEWLPSGREIEGSLVVGKAKIGDYVEVIRTIRNLVHPARYAKDHRRKRVTKQDLEWSFEMSRRVKKVLLQGNSQRLQKLIEVRDGKA